ncbi:MAG: hypothetical protein ABW022_09480 [Actinoplanes sp.]
MPAQPVPYAMVAVFLLAAAGAWAAYEGGLVAEDSGIRACEELRDGTGRLDVTVRDEVPITETQYRETRAVFAGSRHDDIRDHGTKLVDVVWRSSSTAGGTSLGYLGPLTEHRAGLQSACAHHGIPVTLNDPEPAKPA